MQLQDITVIGNARVVLRHQVIENGWVAVLNGRIADLGQGSAPKRCVDLGGDYLIPGLVELHTDHLEPHVTPRPKVEWHKLAAVLAYDAQIAASGITTVFDSLRLGADERKAVIGSASLDIGRVIDGAQKAGLLRADHMTHLRCEICSPDVVHDLETYLAELPVHLVSLMDHTPGQRQFRDIEKLAIYYRGKGGMTETELETFMARRLEMFGKYSLPNRRSLVEIAHAHNVRLASHDDTLMEHVEESLRDGVSLAEFPTTAEAAAASHAAGIAVMMGAPNLVRGGSHSGNVSAEELARAGTLDILSSDYVPASLIQAAFTLPSRVPSITLPEAIATVTATPAAAVGLEDRGEIRAGLRADLVHIRLAETAPVVRQVWREGQRVI
ncbi:MAG: alpha-D-ribose 1-methylphosphonate 5-triphosphate diphosphatase [Proteobacteria bacterium]|nr:alpha-D-ribose 1-methylphosphonate 5-triphosphate diphosphatase [Pseudomonadota bacterium]